MGIKTDCAMHQINDEGKDDCTGLKQCFCAEGYCSFYKSSKLYARTSDGFVVKKKKEDIEE